MTGVASGRRLRGRHLRLWGELLAHSWRTQPARVALMLLIKLVGVASTAAVALALRSVVDGIVAGEVMGAQVAALAMALGTAVIASGAGMELALQMPLVEPVAYLHLDPRNQRDVASLPGLEHLERTDFLDRLAYVRRGTWQIMHGLWAAIEVGFSMLRLVVLLVLLGTVDPRLLALLVFAAVPLVFDRRGARAIARADAAAAEDIRLQRHLFGLATDAGAGKELRVAAAGEELARRQGAAWDRSAALRFWARLRAAGWKAAGWVIFTASFVAALALLISRAGRGETGVGDIVLAITVAVTLRDSIQVAVWRAGIAISSGVMIDHYLWLRDYVAEHTPPAGAERPVPATLRSGITFDDVTFTYPGTDRPALSSLRCHLAAGSVVAIVGEFGSGKTSLVKLLSKFYAPGSGRILVDDVPLSELDTVAWRARMSAAFQDFGRFQLRFADTVGLGDLPHLADRPRIDAAVQAADAQALVDRLPDGLQTQLGKQFGGVDLSEGQWQKTALARASMRQEPLLFVLDEPTASLDAPSEHAILDRYMQRARLLAQRTGAITVVVSHRFSTVTGADQILVLDRGELVESGTHDELVALDGRYAALYRIQATAYALT